MAQGALADGNVVLGCPPTIAETWLVARAAFLSAPALAWRRDAT